MIEALEDRRLFSAAASVIGLSSDLATPALTAHRDAGSAPVITSPSTAVFDEGQSDAFLISGTNGGLASPVPTVKISGRLPKGLKFKSNNNGTATISGTPAAGTSGEYTVIVGAHNSVGSIKQTLTVEVQSAPVITSSSTASFSVGTDDSVTISTIGFPLATISEIGPLPSGISLQSNGDGTATLSGNASAGAGGDYAFTLVASNDAPLSSLSVSALSESGTTVTATVPTSSGLAIGDAVTIAGASPSGFDGTFVVTGLPTPTTFTYQVMPHSLGTATGTITATALPSQVFNLTINQPYTITNQNVATFAAGVSSNFIITTNGFPTGAISASSLPKGLTLTDNGNGTATISGTPASNTVGVHSSTVTVKLGRQTQVSQALTIVVDATPFTVATIPATSNIFDPTGMSGIGTTPIAIPITPGPNQALTLSSVFGTVTANGAAAVQPVTSLVETNSIITATVATTTGIAIGSTVTISGATPSAFNGMFVVSGVTPTTFTFFGGTPFQSLSVSSLTEVNSTVTADVTNTTGLAVGSTVTIAGATPTDYDGTFIVTEVEPTFFEYQALNGLTTPATGTITAAPTAFTAIGTITESPQGGAGIGADGYTTFNNIPATTDIADQGGISGLLDNNGGFFLVGLFLDGTVPVTAPPILNVSNANTTKTITPVVGQTFFIGNGQTKSGAYQQFVVPPTATVLYLGFADANLASSNNLAFHGTPFYSGNSGSLMATLTIGPAKS